MRKRKRAASLAAACMFEMLEERRLLSTAVVTTNADSGAGSLRQAIADATAGDTIDISGAGGTITLASSLTIDKSLTIQGAAGSSSSTIDGGGAVQIFSLSSTPSLTLDNLTLSHGDAPGQNGIGGVISGQGNFTATDCTFDSNHADNGGGAMEVQGTILLTNCTFTNNTAPDAGAIFSNGNITATNCTFYGNSATSVGGAIITEFGETFNNCTFTNNSAVDGGAIFDEMEAVTLNNTIVAGNSASAAGPDVCVDMGWIDATNSLIGNTQDAWFETDVNNIKDVSASLGTLADNGGATETVSLNSDSPAIDAGDDNLAPSTDQRGAARVGTSDIGAFEFDGVVPGSDHAPTFTSTNPTTATSETLFTYNITTNDADSDPVTLTAPTKPSWLTFTDNGDGTATLTGTPTNTDAGNNDVDIQVSDGTDQTDQSFTLDVSAINHAPTFTSTAPTTGTSGTQFSYSITTNDADSDPVTITAPTKPSWLTFTDNGDGTATLSGTPTNNNSGNNSVVLRASDGTDHNDQSFTINVSATNHAPSFTSTAPTTGTAGTLFTYNVTTTDTDGDTLTITAPTKPSWLTLTDNGDGTATLSGTPANGNSGNNSVVLRVSDGTTHTDQSFTVNVAGNNHAPVFSDSPINTTQSNDAVSWTVHATDADSDALTFSTTAIPAWATVTDNHDGSATITGTPANADAGINTIGLRISDGTTHTDVSLLMGVVLPRWQLTSGGLLTVAGDSATNDNIQVWLKGNQVRVASNGVIKNYAASSVNQIEIYGQDGDDLLSANTKNIPVYIVGGAGNDVITGGDENDILTGGGGKDFIVGGGGDDRLNGLQGNDTLDGGAGNDRIYGGDGDDRIYGGLGQDTIHGEDGNDSIYARDGAVDQVFGDAGTNTAQVDASDVLGDTLILLP